MPNAAVSSPLDNLNSTSIVFSRGHSLVWDMEGAQSEDKNLAATLQYRLLTLPVAPVGSKPSI